MSDALLSAPWALEAGRLLVHFLWEAGLVAAALALALELLPDRPRLRHGACLVAVLALFLAPLVTWRLGAEEPGALSVLGAAGPAPASEPVAWLGVTTLLWLAGVLVQGARTSLGFWSSRRLRLRQTSDAPAWQASVDALRARLGIRRPVVVRLSRVVTVPTVVGTLAPVVLLPAYAVTRLSPSELYAVLAHELAHVHRKDELVNLLLALAETLFFFHPAVWWIGHRLRAEREYCCDDVAVALSGDALVYARALERLEASRPPRSSFPRTALASQGGPLMKRIQRLLRAEGRPRQRRTLLPMVLALAGFAGFASAAHGAASSGGDGDEELARIEAALERIQREMVEIKSRIRQLDLEHGVFDRLDEAGRRGRRQVERWTPRAEDVLRRALGEARDQGARAKDLARTYRLRLRDDASDGAADGERDQPGERVRLRLLEELGGEGAVKLRGLEPEELKAHLHEALQGLHGVEVHADAGDWKRELHDALQGLHGLKELKELERDASAGGEWRTQLHEALQGLHGSHELHIDVDDLKGQLHEALKGAQGLHGSHELHIDVDDLKSQLHEALKGAQGLHGSQELRIEMEGLKGQLHETLKRAQGLRLRAMDGKELEVQLRRALQGFEGAERLPRSLPDVDSLKSRLHEALQGLHDAGGLRIEAPGAGERRAGLRFRIQEALRGRAEPGSSVDLETLERHLQEALDGRASGDGDARREVREDRLELRRQQRERQERPREGARQGGREDLRRLREALRRLRGSSPDDASPDDASPEDASPKDASHGAPAPSADDAEFV